MIYLAGTLPAIIWLILRLTMPPGPYEMDQGGRQGTFFPILILYSVAAYAIAIFSAVLAYVGWTHRAGVGVVLLLTAAVDAIIFCFWLVWCFEMYMQQRYPVGNQALAAKIGVSTYTLGRYALTLALGFSALALFLAGVVLTAAGLAR